MRIVSFGWSDRVITLLWAAVSRLAWIKHNPARAFRLGIGRLRQICGLAQSSQGGPTRKPEYTYYDTPYERRLLIREPIPVKLSRQKHASAAVSAQRFGIEEDTRIVTLHVREPAYFGIAASYPRNAVIETYFKAIDYLVEQGYTVVRMGDAGMTPVVREGVVDLAVSPDRSELLELYCLMRSEFMIGTDSGPVAASYLTDTPLLITNVLNPLSIPVRLGVYILKHVVERVSNRKLTLEDRLTQQYFSSSLNLEKYEYIDNTADEILDAVRETISTLQQRPPETLEQIRWNQLICAAAAHELKDELHNIKWSYPEGGFLGDDRIAHSFVEPYMDSSAGGLSNANQDGVHNE